MRIVGGKYRGKKLWAPEGENVRPTSERTREAIFNILYSRLGGNYSSFDLVDIYSGTGAFGLEALSRGFNSVTFIDLDTLLVSRNAKMFLKEQEKISILKVDATNLPHSRKCFDIVFMDAPYAKGLTEKTLKQLMEKNWVKENTLFIVEVKNNEKILIPENLEVVDERISGMAKVLFILKEKSFFVKLMLNFY